MADMGCRQLRPLLLSKHVLRKTFVCAVVRFQRRTTPAFAVSPEYSGVERSGACPSVSLYQCSRLYRRPQRRLLPAEFIRNQCSLQRAGP
jgi:hypothetical protein